MTRKRRKKWRKEIGKKRKMEERMAKVCWSKWCEKNFPSPSVTTTFSKYIYHYYLFTIFSFQREASDHRHYSQQHMGSISLGSATWLRPG